jgi:hypothetical protein
MSIVFFDSNLDRLNALSNIIIWSPPSHDPPSMLRHRAVSPSHTFYRPPLGVFAFHSPFLYSDTPLPCPPSFRLAQAIFSQTFSCTNNPTISSRLFFLLTVPTKMEQTVFKNVTTYNLDARESLKRKNTIFGTGKKFEINCRSMQLLQYNVTFCH